MAHDIAEAFTRQGLDLLSLCELGEHSIGLQVQKNFGCNIQTELMELISVRVNNELEHNGVAEPVVRIELLSSQHPTYAAFKRLGSELAV